MDKKKRNRIMAIIKAIVFILIVFIIPLCIYLTHRDFFAMFTSVSEIEEYVKQYKGYGAIVFIGAQIIQIIICVIPGQPFQFAAGYLYGWGIAILLSIAGAFIGSTITFYLAKLLGRDAMHLFFGDKKAMEYVEKIDSPSGFLVLFILYFIPGFPKDAVSYLAGLSQLKWAPFIVITTAARIPAMFGSILVGTFISTKQYNLVAVVVIVVIIVSILSFRHKDTVLSWSETVYNKLKKL